MFDPSPELSSLYSRGGCGGQGRLGGKVGTEQSEDDDEIGKSSKKKTTFVCVVEDDSDVSREPKYVWVNGKLVTNTKATDKDDKSYKCKLVKNGSRKIEKMSRDLKSVSKTLRKMSKALSEFSK